MLTLLLLVCCCSNMIVNNSVYAEDLNEQMENFKTEMLTVISQLSGKIDNVNSKVYTMQQEITNMKLLYGSNIDHVDQRLSLKLESIEGVVQDLKPHRNCADLYNQGKTISGPAMIAPYWPNSCSNCVSVLCDQDSDGGRWTIIQKRQVVETRENFNRGYQEYAQSFGNMIGGEYWMGLALLHILSQQGNQELHIELEDWDGNKRWAKYSTFSVGPPEDYYRLKVTGYSGDAGDAMGLSNGQAFSTHDRDNDVAPFNCAELNKGGGWWYKQCADAQLNGEPNNATDTPWSQGIMWYQWRGDQYSLKGVTMKIRPTTE
ncbi:unnamed protein product [Meganyctiphanes norvegica]|uniref:Fibrinogen C-terminal domain-containing protein n=1 Tax=Meganyctiphanes norvegica TaxID=48144 RepID=A0AAV2PYH7_MEGNR